MDSADDTPHLVEASKRVAQQALVVCDNRIQLFLLEMQEERNHIFTAFWLSIGISVFGLLTGIALTGLVVAICWPWSPVGTFAILVVVYGGIASFLYFRLAQLRREWQSFSATFNEFRKDRECLEKKLS